MTALAAGFTMETSPPTLDAKHADALRYAFMLHSAQLSLVVSALPKSACTTIKRWFLRLTDEANAQREDLHRYCRAFHMLARFTPERARQHLETSRVIILMREPMRRLASGYADKFVRLHSRGCFEGAIRVMHRYTEAQLGRRLAHDSDHLIDDGKVRWKIPISSRIDLSRGMTFREFLLTASSIPDFELDPHFRPQSAFFSDFPRHELYRIDRLNAILSRLWEQYREAPCLIEPAAPGADKSHSEAIAACARELDRCPADIPSGELARRGLIPTAADLYDDSLRELVHRRYADDFAFFEQAGIDLPDRIPSVSVPMKACPRVESRGS